MKKTLSLAALLVALCLGYVRLDRIQESSPQPIADAPATSSVLQAAIDGQESGIQVQDKGVVSKVLPDDTQGSRHQRFLLKLASGHRILVAHNIDLAPRIPNLRSGDQVAFNGVFEWNDKGGVVHWTHHDPSGRHQPGWLKHEGRKYE